MATERPRSPSLRLDLLPAGSRRLTGSPRTASGRLEAPFPSPTTPTEGRPLTTPSRAYAAMLDWSWEVGELDRVLGPARGH